MRKVQLHMYRCDYCGSHSEVEKDIKACERACKKRKKIEDAKKKWREKYSTAWTREVETIHDVPTVFSKWVKKLFNATIRFSSFDLRFEPLASNSHVAPIGGQTNWCGRNKDGPRGYPGWVGHVSGKITHPEAKKKDFMLYSITDHFNAEEFGFPGVILGFHTCGGSFGQDFSMGVTLFVQDFPKLQEKYQRFLEGHKEYVEFSVKTEDLADQRAKDLSDYIDSDDMYIRLRNQENEIIRARSERDTKLREEFGEKFGKKYIIPNPKSFDEYKRMLGEFGRSVRVV